MHYLSIYIVFEEAIFYANDGYFSSFPDARLPQWIRQWWSRQPLPEATVVAVAPTSLLLCWPWSPPKVLERFPRSSFGYPSLISRPPATSARRLCAATWYAIRRASYGPSTHLTEVEATATNPHASTDWSTAGKTEAVERCLRRQPDHTTMTPSKAPSKQNWRSAVWWPPKRAVNATASRDSWIE